FPGAAQISSGKCRRRRGNDAGGCISSVFEQAHARRTDLYPRTDRSQHSRLIAVSLWGRARASAEIPGNSERKTKKRKSFSGAALVRARKLPSGKRNCATS